MSWKDKHITFLTKKNFNVEEIIGILKNNYKKIEKEEDIKILDFILENFTKKDFSLLNTQELEYLEKTPSENWTKYLIHRQKFNFCENSEIIPNFPIYLIIEPVSACNLRCPFCHQVDDKFTSNKQMMGQM